MESCENMCYGSYSKLIKINFLDRLAGRTISEKAKNHCHIHCLRSYKIKNQKRNGRWGFIPILGMTEAFSSLFALGSFFILIYNHRSKVNHKVNLSPMKLLYLLHYYVGCFAFLSSFLFHFRETNFTRNADYFSAFGSILTGLLVSFNRIVLLKNPKKHKQISKVSMFVGIIYFIFHCIKMSFFGFNYFYNKIACGLMILGTCIFYLIIYFNYKTHKHTKNIVYFIGCIVLGSIVEVLDISPALYLFDSHAFWHLLMALATHLYFNFIAGDIDFHIVKPIIKID